MAQEETRKKKTGMARCLELASQHKGLVFISGILAAAAAVCSFLPYLSIYFIMRELIGVFPDMANANMSVVLRYGWMALGGIAGNVILYFCALMCSHLAAFGTLYELKLAFANHITEIPLGYHLTIGSGRMRKIMDENIESIEKFIAHQFPDFVASLVAPLALVILLLAIDWRYGIVSLFGIILAFVVQFLGFNGSAKEKMHHYQTAQEDMNNASVEYVRGMPEIKAFNQTADSFRRLSKSITDYTSFVLEYAMGWQNCMPGFTTIIHNIYLLLIPVGIFIGMGAEDYRTYSLTFIFYLVLAPAISGVLNKIMYISESFTQIDGNVERMEEVLSIPVLQNQDVGAREQGHSIEFDHVSFSYDTGTSVKALNDVSFILCPTALSAVHPARLSQDYRHQLYHFCHLRPPDVSVPDDRIADAEMYASAVFHRGTAPAPCSPAADRGRLGDSAILPRYPGGDGLYPGRHEVAGCPGAGPTGGHGDTSDGVRHRDGGGALRSGGDPGN